MMNRKTQTLADKARALTPCSHCHQMPHKSWCRLAYPTQNEDAVIISHSLSQNRRLKAQGATFQAFVDPRREARKPKGAITMSCEPRTKSTMKISPELIDEVWQAYKVKDWDEAQAILDAAPLTGTQKSVIIRIVVDRAILAGILKLKPSHPLY